MSGTTRRTFFSTEDWWAVWLGLGMLALGLAFWFFGGTIKAVAVSPPNQWTAWNDLAAHYAQTWPWYALAFLLWATVFTVSTALMGFRPGRFLPGFAVLFVASLVIFSVSNSRFFHHYSLEAPLVALALGLAAGNLVKLPEWFTTSLRTEYYIKTGIVLLGATLPLTLVAQAGPVAFLQATIVSLATWFTIFLVATQVFGLGPQFGAVLGAGGAVCGVSASIAVGGAVKADKNHIAVSISIVTVWAVVMIFFLPYASKFLALSPGVAGAWVGTSEFADAAGFAAAQTLASATGTDAPVQTFTLMKVIGRDIWVGIWAFVLAIISCLAWESTGDRSRVKAAVIWERFPKFVIGFFAASVIMSVSAALVGEHLWKTSLNPFVVAPIKTLRTWTFIFAFLCIGLTTRFRELARFGMPPFWSFTAGVLVNVPLGYFLSKVVFSNYWQAVK